MVLAPVWSGGINFTRTAIQSAPDTARLGVHHKTVTYQKHFLPHKYRGKPRLAIWLGSADEKAGALYGHSVGKALLRTRRPVDQTPAKQL